MTSVSTLKSTKLVKSITPSVPEAAKMEVVKPKIQDISFPVEVYPEAIQNMMKDLHSQQGLPFDYCCTVFLSFIAGVVGSKIRLKAIGNWQAPLSIWTVIIGESGVMKSPVFDFFKQPIIDLEERLQREYEKALYKYKKDIREYEKNKDLDLDVPVEPKRGELLIESGTTEGLKDAIFSNIDVIQLYDELIELFRSFGQYKGGRGTDQTTYLKLFNGSFMKLNNKSTQTAFLPFSNTCITGGIQPEVLPELFRNNRDSDGTIFRFLYCFKDLKIPETINENGISKETEGFYSNLINKLYDIPRKKDITDKPQMYFCEFCPGGKKAFLDWRTTYVREINNSNEKKDRGIKNKLIGYVPRLALLLEILTLQCVDLTRAINPNTICVSEASVKKAIQLIQYFEYNFQKIIAYSHNNPLTAKNAVSSGIDWRRVFDKDTTLQRKVLIERINGLRELGKEYVRSERTIDTLFKDELWLVKTGFYTYINPNEE